ncbi:MAG: hypothetical protein Q9160_008035, partial [Pyrenula sp. 1 TL-2023]
LTLSSSTQKHKGIYKLKVHYQAPSTGKVWKDEEIEAPFHRWFSDDGFLQKKHLQHWLASSIEMVGMADPEAKKGPGSGGEKGGLIEDERVVEVVGEEALEEASPRKSGGSARKGKRKA